MKNSSAKKRLSTLCAISLASCASAQPVVVAARPSSMPAPVFDFVEVTPGDCSPPLSEGVFMTWDSARALVSASKKRELNHELVRLSLEERAALAESRARQSEDALSRAQSWLSQWGFPVGLGIGLVAAVGSAIAGWSLAK